ncbi:MAG: flagellar biosynthesis regulator FlaF [Pseudomonadota bacterium]
MNAHLKAHRTYGQVNQAIRSERSIELELFARVTKQMSQYCGSRGRCDADLASILHENRMLWSTLATAVADPENLLDQQLRAQIFYLAEFTDQHTRKVLRGDASVDALRDINFSIMKGLQGEAKAA